MAKVKITGHASGSGVLTITAPNTSTDRTVTLPDSTGTLLDSTSTLDATKVSGTHTSFASTGIDDNANANAITIDSSERVLINGTPSNLDAGENNSYAFLRVRGNTAGTTSDGRLALTTGYKAFQLGANDPIGSIWFGDDTGGDWASIKCLADGQGGGSSGSPNDADDYPSRLEFQTTADGAGSPTTHLTIKADGRGLSQFTAKAWVNFNGQDSSISARAGHNVSSITDHGTGDYTVNFTNNMANDNYVSFGSTIGASANHHSNIFGGTLPAVGSIRIKAPNSAAGGTSYTLQDPNQVNLIIFGG